MEKKRLSVIGSTGSIGVQALEVAREQGLQVRALAAAGRNLDLLERQARELVPALVAVEDESAAAVLRDRLRDLPVQVASGQEGVCRAAAAGEVDLVLNAAVGIAGLRPTLAALEQGKTLALANKESLVCAGELVMGLARQKGVPVLPVDSEHSAVHQCLRAGRPQEVSRVILTASGGPFFGKKPGELRGVTAKEALRHPSWTMGAKITVDSSTMMNKGFEIIEAAWLFGLTPEQLDVLVHPESIVHSMVEFADGATMAQLSPPDMRLPIQYALLGPDRVPAPRKRLDLAGLGALHFHQPDREAFPCMALCERALREKGNRGAVINGANEAAVALFLNGEIGYLDIFRLVDSAVRKVPYVPSPTLGQIFDSDRQARLAVRESLGQ